MTPRRALWITGTALFLLAGAARAAEPGPQAKQAAKLDETAKVERGRYLIKMAGCNDCHTSGYGLASGKVPEKQWLMGDTLGWYGPWGTTYATNLRLYMQGLSENQWVKAARKMKTRPPMPWFTLRDITDGDLRAMYAFVRYLGPGGEPAPAYLPPFKEPKPPFIQFPKN